VALARRSNGEGGAVRRSITGRFVLLIATAAVLPLVVYGLISVSSLRSGTEQSVGKGNQAVAQQVAAYIRQYFDNNLRVLASIGTEVRGTQLEQWQQERILRNHVLDFHEFREISIFDASGRLQATSRVGPSSLTIPDSADVVGPDTRKYAVATPYEDADALPTTTIAVPVVGGAEDRGWIVAEISLEELWRTVDHIKVGSTGYALLMDEHFKLLAHGKPNDNANSASGEEAAPAERALSEADRAEQPSTEPKQFANDRG
jgi:hypothetical protein